jgi:hypothetical protein
MDEVKYHSETIRNVQDVMLSRGESMFNELTNMLAGIWDGYLYDELIPTAESSNIGLNNIIRIKTIVLKIKESMTK